MVIVCGGVICLERFSVRGCDGCVLYDFIVDIEFGWVMVLIG